MSQVSPPLRIALIATVALLGVWALLLRPQPAPPVTSDPAAVETASTPAAQADPSAAAAAAANANASVAAAEATAGQLTGETPAAGTGAITAPGAAATTTTPEVELNRQALAKLPTDVARAVRSDKVVAILFWNSRAPEDRRVRRALRDATADAKGVFVRVAPVSQIARYAPITRGVDVAQSPTLVVVDSDLHAEALVGYVARTTIRQALSDAARAGS